MQNIRTGELSIETVPPPALQPGGIRITTACSLISIGTEKMLIDLAAKNLIGKARARPDIVQQIIQKARKEGAIKTLKNVMSKLEQPMPLGYSAAGLVESVGNGVYEFKVGDRVAIAGAGYANHAEVNYVPKNLVASIPDNVSFEEAAYTTVGCIALHGIRLASPELGETVIVIGLGLIGLIATQILKANGCNVIGVDLDASKVRLGIDLGLDVGVVSPTEDARQVVDSFTKGRGADHTIITAATPSNDPIELASSVTRRKGTVVAVGAIGLNLPRDSFYKKELSVKVAMSYGPGRYDRTYEEKGIDYPYDYVRWTEQRNMEAILRLISKGQLNVSALTTQKLSFENALDAYTIIRKGEGFQVGIILDYDVDREQSRCIYLTPSTSAESRSELGIGFVGAGNYASAHLLPYLKRDRRVRLQGLATVSGLSARSKGEKFDFHYCTTDTDTIFEDPDIDVVFIVTPHSSHAKLVVQALQAGKHVFVEKPMIVSEDQLDEVSEVFFTVSSTQSVGVMVGYNRRFAPMVKSLKNALPDNAVKQIIYRVNSGPIDTSTWLHDPDEGSGMLVGEMCHFIDLMQFITGERPIRVYAQSLRLGRADLADQDNLSITISFNGGSVGILSYATVGSRSMSKERVEVYSSGMSVVLDDFRVLEIFDKDKKYRTKSLNQDKGQAAQISETITSFCDRHISPIPFEELVSGMQVVFAARRSMKTGSVVNIDPISPR